MILIFVDVQLVDDTNIMVWPCIPKVQIYE